MSLGIKLLDDAHEAHDANKSTVATRSNASTPSNASTLSNAPTPTEASTSPESSTPAGASKSAEDKKLDAIEDSGEEVGASIIQSFWNVWDGAVEKVVVKKGEQGADQKRDFSGSTLDGEKEAATSAEPAAERNEQEEAGFTQLAADQEGPAGINLVDNEAAANEEALINAKVSAELAAREEELAEQKQQLAEEKQQLAERQAGLIKREGELDARQVMLMEQEAELANAKNDVDKEQANKESEMANQAAALSARVAAVEARERAMDRPEEEWEEAISSSIVKDEVVEAVEIGPELEAESGSALEDGKYLPGWYRGIANVQADSEPVLEIEEEVAVEEVEDADQVAPISGASEEKAQASVVAADAALTLEQDEPLEVPDKEVVDTTLTIPEEESEKVAISEPTDTTDPTPEQDSLQVAVAANVDATTPLTEEEPKQVTTVDATATAPASPQQVNIDDPVISAPTSPQQAIESETTATTPSLSKTQAKKEAKKAAKAEAKASRAPKKSAHVPNIDSNSQDNIRISDTLAVSIFTKLAEGNGLDHVYFFVNGNAEGVVDYPTTTTTHNTISKKAKKTFAGLIDPYNPESAMELLEWAMKDDAAAGVESLDAPQSVVNEEPKQVVAPETDTTTLPTPQPKRRVQPILIDSRSLEYGLIYFNRMAENKSALVQEMNAIPPAALNGEINKALERLAMEGGPVKTIEEEIAAVSLEIIVKEHMKAVKIVVSPPSEVEDVAVAAPEEVETSSVSALKEVEEVVDAVVPPTDDTQQPIVVDDEVCEPSSSTSTPKPKDDASNAQIAHDREVAEALQEAFDQQWEDPEDAAGLDEDTVMEDACAPTFPITPNMFAPAISTAKKGKGKAPMTRSPPVLFTANKDMDTAPVRTPSPPVTFNVPAKSDFDFTPESNCPDWEEAEKLHRSSSEASVTSSKGASPTPKVAPPKSEAELAALREKIMNQMNAEQLLHVIGKAKARVSVGPKYEAAAPKHAVELPFDMPADKEESLPKKAKTAAVAAASSTEEVKSVEVKAPVAEQDQPAKEDGEPKELSKQQKHNLRRKVNKAAKKQAAKDEEAARVQAVADEEAAQVKAAADQEAARVQARKDLKTARK